MVNHKFRYSPGDLFCGIDGGGTTTRVAVCNKDGQVIYSFNTGTINHYGAGISKVRENFGTIACRLVEDLGCLPGIIYTGNSALSGLAEDALTQNLTGGVFQPAKIIFHSDVYIALLGFTMGNTGTMVIAGTGSMACGIDAYGVYHTVGGWGQILGDEGSGYHIALEGIKSGLRAYDGISEYTILTDKLLAFFRLEKAADIIDKIYNPPVEKSVIAAFSTEVEIAAKQGDKVARDILAAEAEWLYKLAMSITSKCKTKNLGYYGSVLNENELVRSLLEAKLNTHSISLNKPMLSPELGAIVGALRAAGITVTKTVINNLLKYKE